MEVFKPVGGSTADLQTFGEWHSLGKGIPFTEGSGFQAWVTNLHDAALSAGSQHIAGVIQVQGVWLGD